MRPSDDCAASLSSSFEVPCTMNDRQKQPQQKLSCERAGTIRGRFGSDILYKDRLPSTMRSLGTSGPLRPGYVDNNTSPNRSTMNMNISTTTSLGSTALTMPQSAECNSRTTVRSRPRPSSSANQIRSRLLNRLGFYNSAPQVPDCASLITYGEKPRPMRRPMFQSDDSSQQALTEGTRSLSEASLDDSCSDGTQQLCRSLSISTRSLSSGSSFGDSNAPVSPTPSRVKKTVSFQAEVRTILIPARSDYSERMRAALWTPAMEMQQAAARNCLEFAAERWDWRSAVEDEDMIWMCRQKVHPVHFQSRPDMMMRRRECNLNRHFVTVMSAQKQSSFS